MKVEIKIEKEILEPYIVIHTNKMTDKIEKIVNIVEENNTSIITVKKDDEYVVLDYKDIYMIRIENGNTCVYDKNNKYTSKKRLYEFENILNDNFMKISKYAIINLRFIKCVQKSFGGTLLVVLKNGNKDYVSRMYIQNLKKYLGV